MIPFQILLAVYSNPGIFKNFWEGFGILRANGHPIISMYLIQWRRTTRQGSRSSRNHSNANSC